MGIINQPHNDISLGIKLNELLILKDTDKYDSFYILSAYVKRSGVSRIKEAIVTFRQGGGKVKAVVGIDQKNSSVEGISDLSEIVDELYIYHSESLMQTFHPKLYALEKKNKAIAFIGSNNLTGGGLFTNYETNFSVNFDLTSEQDKEKFQAIKSAIELYSNTASPCCKRVTSQLIQELTQKGYITSETNLARQIKRVARDIQLSRRERIFGSETFRLPQIRLSIREEIEETDILNLEPLQIPSSFSRKGNTLWKKENIPSSDAQKVSSGTNVTGVLRLSQAGFRVNDDLIDHTTYFINHIFNKLEWTTEYRRDKQPLLVAFARFQIKMLGEYKGEYELKISHDTERISGQGNVPTTLHWSDAIEIIKEKDLTGKNLSIYGSSTGSSEPFFIEIN